MNPRSAMTRFFQTLAQGLLCASLACVQLPGIRYPEGSREQDSGNPAGQVRAADDGSEATLNRCLAEAGLEIPGRPALEAEATGHRWSAGNQVTLLFDGPQAFAAMSAAIAGARDSINLETYIFEQDEMGLRFADLLIRKQGQGVQVNVIYDCVGTLGTPEAFFDRMREAGIHLCPFNPVNPLRRPGRWQINNRDHRKILVVDGQVAFTGGVNISDSYANGSRHHRKSAPPSPLGWRDTQVRIEGPAVAALQLLFVENWFSQKDHGLDRRAYFPPLAKAGDKAVLVVGTQPGGDFEIYRAYLEAIGQARESIHLTAAYFVPDPQLLKGLESAARRGVKVELILTNLNDSGVVHQASQAYYHELLKAGVRIFQLDRAVLHAKTGVIDGDWSTVGSTNMDMRSFGYNKEINIMVRGPAFGREMEAAFLEDLGNSTEITPQAWDQRPAGDRVKQWAARVLARWL